MWHVDDGRSTKAEVRDAPPHDHAVHVYADDRAISQELVRFVEDGLVLGESVVVVANSLNRAAIAAWRADHPPIGDSEFLLVADASETLETFMVAGKPDPALFEATVGSIVEWAARRRPNGAGVRRDGGGAVGGRQRHGGPRPRRLCGTTWLRIGSSSCCAPIRRCSLPGHHLPTSTRCVTVIRTLSRSVSCRSLQLRRQRRVVRSAATDSGPRRRVRGVSDCEEDTRRLGATSPHQNCEIVTSELAANALLHAESPSA